jgi:putative addiction module CopG family antidote
MTIRITLPTDLEEYVQEKLEHGRYRDANEAVADALRLLKQRDENEYEALRATLQERASETGRGRSIPFDSKLRKQIRQRGMKRLANLQRSRGT